MQRRCEWAKSDLMTQYHDLEWGVPVHDDRALFEMLVLDGAQAGLSWETILRKRDGYRAAFDRFDIEKVAAYDQARIEKLILDPGIVRNRLKITSTVLNAQLYLEVRREFDTFDAYLWGFVDGEPIQNARKTLAEIPATTELSDRLSSDLKRRGFKFVGSTICYSILQAAGLVNDHVVYCFRYPELSGPSSGAREQPRS